MDLQNSKKSNIIVLIIFAAALGLFLAFSNPAFLLERFVFEQNSSNPEITSVLFSQDCEAVIETTEGRVVIKTDYETPERCLQFMLASISDSNKYAALRDRSGGLDSRVQVYSVDANDNVGLDIYGTSEIYDLMFLTDDCLVVLNGYQMNHDELWLRIYDVAALFEDYPDNVKNLHTQYRFFARSNDPAFYKSINLPDIGESYDRLKRSGSFLEVFGKRFISEEPLIRYEIDNICSFF